MKINILIDTWEKNSAGIREITNPSERPNKVYDVVGGEKIVVIGYGDGAEELSFNIEKIMNQEGLPEEDQKDLNYLYLQFLEIY